MWTAASIRRHIIRLADDQIFSTREFLTYGLRGAVDQALYRLVKSKFIVRLARGIFIKKTKAMRIPSVQEIAIAKARAFGKRLYMHGLDAMDKFGLSASGNEFPTFVALGASSSFKALGIQVDIRGLAPRYIRLDDSPAGIAIRAMRQLPKSRQTLESLNQTIANMFRTDRELMRRSAWIMPSWLSDLLYNGSSRCAIGIIP